MSTVDPHDLTDRLDELTEALRGCGISDGTAAAEIAEKAIDTARQAIAAAEESWQNVIATRQMSNDANARLRAVLLEALGETDDGETALIQYVQRLADSAKPTGRGWAIPAQPSRHVTAVRGRWGGLWRRAATDQHGFTWRAGDRWQFADRYLTWGELLAGWGPLTDATNEEK